MNITIFIGGLSGGGAERVVCNLASYLYGKGHSVEILTMSDDCPTYAISDGISRKCLITDSERSWFVFDAMRRLVRFIKYLRTHKTDCYIVFLPITTIMLLSFRGLVSAKVVASERVDPSTYSTKKQSRLKRLAHKADAWVFQTNEQKNWYGEAVGNKKVRIIPNAINQEFVKPKYFGTRNKSIVSFGRMTKQKNHRLLISAFAKIAVRYPEYKLCIYGEGPLLPDLEAMVAEAGLQERIQFPGYTTRIGDKIKDAALFVLSSDYEGMPNALMEAMALGLPCISTDCGGGGARFLIENGVNGLLVPQKDADTLATAMDKILGNPELADRLGHEAHRICERLAPEKIYSEWEKLIKEVVNI